MNLLDTPGVTPNSLATSPGTTTDEAPYRRLARAKLRLDRLERDATTKDLSALTAARVEFALAARDLADTLIALGLGSENADGSMSDAAKGLATLPPAPWETRR